MVESAVEAKLTAMGKPLNQPPQIVYEFLSDEQLPTSLDELLMDWLNARRARRKTVVSSDEVGENTNTPTPNFFM